MTIRERIEKAVYLAIDEINKELPIQKHIEKLYTTRLIGEFNDKQIECLAVAVQDNIEKEFNMTVILIDKGKLIKDGDPFQNVSNLVNYIALSI